jgi:hypothetical protein
MNGDVYGVQLAFVRRAISVGFTEARKSEASIGCVHFWMSFVLAFVRRGVTKLGNSRECVIESLA